MKAPVLVNRLLIAHHPVAAARQFMRQRLTGDYGIRRLFFFQVVTLCLVTMLNGKIRRLDKRPGRITIAVTFTPAVDAA